MPRPKNLSVERKKTLILEQLTEGVSVSEAARNVGVTRENVYYYKSSDESFKMQVDEIMHMRGTGERPERPSVPDFPEFCEKYLHTRLFWHQLQWFDVLEGRTPRDLHPSETFEQGDPDMLVINTPPGHAKSQTITVMYSVWRVVKDPSTRIVIVSKSQRLAIQFLLTIKNYLTHPKYRQMQLDFAPVGGFDKDSASWKQDLIYVNSDARDVQEKDPTVQAIGIGGQLYGARADLIVLDDCVDNQNAKDFEKQIHWIQTEVSSRLPEGGKILVVGTRLQAQDLYVELRNPERYNSDEDEESPWTYFAQPAVLEFHDDVARWKTLWPYCDRPSGTSVLPNDEGLFEKWTGRILSKRRRRMPPSAWARVYMQEQVSEETVFPLDLINASISGYSPGLLPDTSALQDGGLGRKGGMNGLFVMAGLDPASVGHTAAVCVGLDIRTGERWVLEVHNEPGMKPEAMKNLITGWQDKYEIREWRIERNAFQGFLTQDSALRSYIASRGGTLVEHTTGRNKHDDLLGVMSMSSLFEQGLIRLPRPQTEGVKALVQQLSYWTPDLPKTSKTDCVMALWFTHIRCVELVQTVSRSQAFNNGAQMFMTKMDMASRTIIPTTELETAGVSPSRSMWG